MFVFAHFFFLGLCLILIWICGTTHSNFGYVFGYDCIIILIEQRRDQKR